ncbi:DUF4129 domain-containing protein [Paenibacillus oenotherae]|uniref:DUF4129 domain-containing protein n=1 Tax=Paenibacillus oenotherae TaxID=1435645 RepID=A0ABS7DC85_9BACL|nr:DUF4129 domain-containing protein [Paenibacillus oenotherae]MBW7477545.1 DUF4129 domain-containing protein [Paenibacillus oenotherae]
MMGVMRESALVMVRGSIEMVLYLPIAILLQVYLLPADQGWLWLLPMLIAYPAGYRLNRLLSLHHPAAIMLISIVAAALYGMSVYGISIIGIVTFITAAAGMYRGQMMAVHLWSTRFYPWQYGTGLFTYFTVSIVFGWMEPFQPFKWPLLGFGLLSLVLTLNAINKSYVNTESLTNEHMPRVEKTVKRQNRLFVAIIIVVSVLIVFTYQLQWLFTALWNAFQNWLNSWQLMEPTEEPPAEVTPAPMPRQELELPTENRTTLNIPWDLILYIFTGILALVLLFIIVRYIRHLPKLWKALKDIWKQMLQRERITVAAGYVDEIEDISKPKRIRVWLSGRNKQPRIKWKDLQDNESRIRYLYRQWLGRAIKGGYVFKPHFTPQENGRELIATSGSSGHAVWVKTLLEQYMGVRYGARKVKDEKLQQLIDEKPEQ